jgi:hypothetical protein
MTGKDHEKAPETGHASHGLKALVDGLKKAGVPVIDATELDGGVVNLTLSVQGVAKGFSFADADASVANVTIAFEASGGKLTPDPKASDDA